MSAEASSIQLGTINLAAKSVMGEATQAVLTRLKTKEQTVGVDPPQIGWEVLVPVLMELLSMWLGDCLNKNQAEYVASQMLSKDSFWRRVAIRQCVNQLTDEDGRPARLTASQKSLMRASVAEELDESDRNVAEAIIGEVKSNVPAGVDWNFFA